VIVVQERQPLGQAKEGGLIPGLSHIEIMPMLSNGNLKSVQACH